MELHFHSTSFDFVNKATRRTVLVFAIESAHFLLESPLFDDVLGGGYWWNTLNTMKPTNANALVVLFFSHLYEVLHAQGTLRLSDQ